MNKLRPKWENTNGSPKLTEMQKINFLLIKVYRKYVRFINTSERQLYQKLHIWTEAKLGQIINLTLIMEKNPRNEWTHQTVWVLKHDVYQCGLLLNIKSEESNEKTKSPNFKQFHHTLVNFGQFPENWPLGYSSSWKTSPRETLSRIYERTKRLTTERRVDLKCAIRSR